jgi:hypothetical protein
MYIRTNVTCSLQVQGVKNDVSEEKCVVQGKVRMEQELRASEWTLISRGWVGQNEHSQSGEEK